MPTPHVRGGTKVVLFPDMRTLRARSTSLVALAALLTAAGCGSQSEPGTAGKAGARPHPASKGVVSDGLSPNMVAAVAGAKDATATVRLKFELTGRPTVGEPLDVRVGLVPVAGGLDRIAGKFQGDDGLDIVSGDVLAATEKPAPGTAINHTLRVVPRRDGIFILRAVISEDAGNQSLSQTFTIPVIAGNGLSQGGAASQPTAASGPGRPAPAAAAQ
jgi:hypothetical protein